ncbi:MAG: TrkA family potassium uptake protein [Spirochaetales bacterium]|jgi:trk system potassium uptake protein|nr:TrkA family potassium uptake protein [Spirochaetales bacterium]
MYITVAGGGRIGRGLAKRLVEAKHDVVVIDRDKAICESIYAEYGALTINGNATDLTVLENAGIERSDIAIAAMRNDSDNLTFALLAKHLAVPNIHVRMNDPKYEDIYRKIGVTNIARVTELLIEQFIVNIETPELRKVISLGDLEVDIVNVPAESVLVDMQIAEITRLKGFPKGVLFTCVFHDLDKSFEVPAGSTVVAKQDRLFLCGKRQNILKVAKLIAK